MAKERFWLTPRDRDLIKGLEQRLAKEIRTESSQEAGERPDSSPEVYVIHPPCTWGIPAATIVNGALRPGHATCCLYRLVPVSGSYHDLDWELEPIRWPDGTQATKEVYNLREVALPDVYYLAKRQKNGRWLAEDPLDSAATPAPTTTTGVPNTCGGSCIWTWDAASSSWYASTDSCTIGTTTTENAATTTTSCPCFILPTSTTAGATTTTGSPTTTSTPTTVSPDCTCIYPDFCGLSDGQVTESGCSKNEIVPVDCPPTSTSTSTTTTSTPTSTSTTSTPTTTLEPTTTTTCDCATTTAAPDCSTGCDWEWAPWLGSWINTAYNCSSSCPCPTPEKDGEGCATAHTGCVNVSVGTTTTAVPSCGGSCEYWWHPNLGWSLTNNSCHGTLDCFCESPSYEGTDCAPLRVSCVTPRTTTAAPTTTTVDPCIAICYTTTTGAGTTTTTTTTCNPSGNAQLYICRNGAWSPSDDCGCDSGSTGIAPGCGGYDDPAGQQCSPNGSVLNCGCEEATTTTAACDPCDSACSQCRWVWSTACGSWIQETDPCGASCPCVEPDTDSAPSVGQVAMTGCLSPASTTTSTTCAPCDPKCEQCTWRWSDSCSAWVLTVDCASGGGCACETPPATGSTDSTTKMPCTTTLAPTSTTTSTSTVAPTTTCPPTTTSTTSTAAPTTTTVCPATTTSTTLGATTVTDPI